MIGESRLFFGLESLVIQIAGSSKSIRCEVHSWSRFLACVSSIDFELRNKVRNSLMILTKLRFHCKSHFRQIFILMCKHYDNLEFLSCTDKYLIVQIELIVQQPRPQRTLDINFARARYRSIASIGSALDTSTISEAKSLTPCLGRYLWSEPSSTENTNTCQRTFDSPFQCFLIYLGSIFRSITWA